MKYQEALLQNKEKGICPFCSSLTEVQVIFEGEKMLLILNRAPYIQHHLMIISRRHVQDRVDLNEAEKLELDMMVHRGISLLKNSGAKAINHLLRDGPVNPLSRKSQEHFHYHLIPDCFIITKEIALAGDEKDRKFLSEEEMQEVGDRLKVFLD